jgi:hypothetical protein
MKTSYLVLDNGLSCPEGSFLYYNYSGVMACFIHRISQVELKQQIEILSEELKKISESQQCPLDIDQYIRKLINAKLKVTVVSNILQTVQV